MYKSLTYLLCFLLNFGVFDINAQISNNRKLDSLIIEAVESTEKSNFEKSLNLYNKLLDLAEEQESGEHLILGNLNLGILYWRINESEKALNYYFKALDLAKKYGNIEHLNSIYNNIGIVYSKNNEKKKALENFQAALEISKKLDNKIKIAINLINIGNVYSDIEDYEEAQKNLYKAKDIIESENETGFLSVIYNNLGENFNEQKNYKEALDHFNLAVRTADTSDYYYYSIFLNNLGNTYYILLEYDSALTYIDKGLELSIQLNNKENIVNAYTLLAKVYQDYGYTNKALMNYNKTIAWKDSLLNERSQKWVSEMQMKYEFGKKEKEVEFLEKKNKLNVLIWILSLSISVIISFFIIYSFRNRHIKSKQRNEILKKEKELAKLEKDRAEVENKFLHEELTATEEINRIKEEKLKEEIQHKNRELTSQAMHHVNKNEILENIEEKIKEVNPENITDTTKKVKEINRLIKSNLSIENDWKIFQLHFENVHKDFFNNLSAGFPDLSQSDLRYCAYIVLNLNNREIAQIFNISQDSIRKRKQRLREKLKLNKEANLVDSLIKYSG